MRTKSRKNLLEIRFEDQLLPDWAQLLDLAANLCLVPEDVCRWFSRFTNSSGTDDARTVMERCGFLRASLIKQRDSISTELQRRRNDGQPLKILAAWMYSLDTMIQEARTRKTCSWIVAGTEDAAVGHADGGDITLRRV